MVAGGGPECVKAFLGPLPPGKTGYTFTTDAIPTQFRHFGGILAAVWLDAKCADVSDVPGMPGYVRIPVRIVNV